MPWTSPQAIDVTSPQFDSQQPATWNYAAPERRVFGLAVYQQRLYYAVADGLQIWSVGLNADGSFADDAVIELVVPPPSARPKSQKLLSMSRDGCSLPTGPAPTGAFDFNALAVPAIGRVLRYEVVETMPNGRRIWQQKPDDYAIGFPPDFRNGNGGVAIGYNYDSAGEIYARIVRRLHVGNRRGPAPCLRCDTGRTARPIRTLWILTACKGTARGV